MLHLKQTSLFTLAARDARIKGQTWSRTKCTIVDDRNSFKFYIVFESFQVVGDDY